MRPSDPGGTPIEAFDQIRAGFLADRSQFFKDLTMRFYGYNRPGAEISESARSNGNWPIVIKGAT
jgi:non-heme chloroperoxidase